MRFINFGAKVHFFFIFQIKLLRFFDYFLFKNFAAIIVSNRRNSIKITKKLTFSMLLSSRYRIGRTKKKATPIFMLVAIIKIIPVLSKLCFEILLTTININNEKRKNRLYRFSME